MKAARGHEAHIADIVALPVDPEQGSRTVWGDHADQGNGVAAQIPVGCTLQPEAIAQRLADDPEPEVARPIGIRLVLGITPFSV